MKKQTDIAALRLIRQQIAKHEFGKVKDLVAYMGAMQAQDYAMAKWAIGLRLGSNEKTVQDAIDKGQIFRTHVLRPTWHFVSAENIYWMLELSKPRIGNALKARYKELELTEKFLVKTNKLLGKLLESGNHLTRDDITTEFKKEKIALDNNRSSHIMMHAELEGLIVSGRSNGSKHTYALLSDRVKKKKNISHEEAIAKLAQNYFSSHGPATLPDFIWWSGLGIKDARHALEMVKEKFVSEKIGEETYWFNGTFKSHTAIKSSIYLLPAFDEYLISYKDRAASILEANHKRTMSSNGIFWPVIVEHGIVTGLWKRSIKKDTVIIEPDFFNPHKKLSATILEKAAKPFGDFLNKKIKVI